MSTDLIIPAELEQAANYLRTMVARARQNIVDIGLKLIEVDARFKRAKDFYEWAQAECGISRGSAENFMHAATFVQKYPNLETLDYSVIYELAAPKTSPEIVDAVISGQVEPTIPAIREAKRALKGETPALPASPAARLFSGLLNFMRGYDGQDERVTGLLDAIEEEELDLENVIPALHELQEVIEEVLDELER